MCSRRAADALSRNVATRSCANASSVSAAARAGPRPEVARVIGGLRRSEPQVEGEDQVATRLVDARSVDPVVDVPDVLEDERDTRTLGDRVARAERSDEVPRGPT